jgi:hypothetical protein
MRLRPWLVGAGVSQTPAPAALWAWIKLCMSAGSATDRGDSVQAWFDPAAPPTVGGAVAGNRAGAPGSRLYHWRSE